MYDTITLDKVYRERSGFVRGVFVCLEVHMENNFYHSQRWRTVRRKALRRDKFLCVECSRYGKKTPATVVHHIKERSAYPELEYELGNLESLCEACHNKRHPEKGSKRKGRY